MKHSSLLLIILFSVLGTSFFAQMPGGGNNKMMSKLKDMNIAKVYGKVIDAKTKAPVEYASVVLLWFNKDSVINGVLAKSNGDFLFENLPAFGSYRVKVMFMGYKNFETRVYISPPDKMEIDMGNIKLQPDEQLLKEVDVVAEKPIFTTTIDRKVYNVDKDMSVKGGTGLDAVKNIPTINVDADGNVQLRNQDVTIYVDGKPTTLTLQQIPADQIDRIEVISNPSAKYSAETTGGILNVILKKNSKPGYNGMLMGGIGTNDRYNGMANLSIKENPINLSMMYNFNTQINYTKGYTDRTDLYNQSVTDYYRQDNHTFNKATFQFGRVALDYNLNNRNTITLSGSMVNGHFGTSDVQEYTTKNASSTLLNQGFQINNSLSSFINVTSGMIYKKTFPTQGKELTLDVNHNYSDNTNRYLYSIYTRDPNGNEMFGSPAFQRIKGGGYSNQYVAQLDFTNPYAENKKIEAGARFYYKLSNNVNNVYDSTSNNAASIDTFLTTTYNITQIISAAYATYSSKAFWNINYQAGLRLEQTYFQGDLLNKKTSFNYAYPKDLNTLAYVFFPSLFLTKQVSQNSEFQFNVSRKIDRPGFFQTMPFIMFADKKNYRIGNPLLKPEFINISELNHNLTFGTKGNWLSSFYFRYTEQPISNTAYPSAQDTTKLVNTFINGKNSYQYGFENTVRYTFFKKLTVSMNINPFYLSITSDPSPHQATQTFSGWSYNSKATIQWQLPWDMNFQVNGTYNSPKVIINGTTNPMYFMDISLSKMIATKWNFNLVLSDVFNTKRMGMTTSSSYYDQILYRRREARFLRFTVTYMFGKLDASIFKKRKGQNNNQNGNPDGLDFN